MFKQSYKIDVMVCLYMTLTLHAAHSHAIALSNAPLFLTSGAEPNVMFVLDDSGSMKFEVMPETYRISDVVNVFPISGALNYGSNVAAPGSATISGTAAVNGKLLRSKINTVYYDPSKRYTPWVATDGTSTMPNASPTCALHDPMVTGTGESRCRNLTVDEDRVFNGQNSTWYACSNAATCSTSTSSTLKLYPATYYWFTGTASEIWNTSKYQEVKITSLTATYTGHGRDSGKRTDCGVVAGVTTCTYAQEIQNFANWYTYYRSRVLTARAGIGRAFAAQQDDMRVGFGAINKAATTIDGVSTPIVMSGVRKFNSTVRTQFLNSLYTKDTPGGTPLPKALEGVGQYFSRSDNKGPWGNDPGLEDTGAHLTCRASYAILMTDGYWTSYGTSGNADNVAGTTITNHTPPPDPASAEAASYVSSYTYTPAAPYMDTQANTLADAAMRYWKADLRTDLLNKVPVNDVDPAFWQHMTTFTIGLGVSGDINPVPSVPYAIKHGTNTNGAAITWPTFPVASAEIAAKIDDMVHAAINGHGGFFSAADPDEFAQQLNEILTDIAARENNNAAAAATNSTSLNQDSVVFQAKFSSSKWTGEINATRISEYGVIASSPLWTSSIPAAASRKIYTHNGTTGVEFLWDNLSDAQKDLLNDNDIDSYGQNRLNWVRGVDNETLGDPVDLRDRDGELLGDIVNSDPAYAGTNNSYFDRLPAAAGASKYKTYYDTYKRARRPVLYVGANDGMLHAFNARSELSPNVPDPTAGKELFAYVPSMVYGKLRGLSSESYGDKSGVFPHEYTVDGPIYISDAYIDGQWRNILVGALGAGGRGIYVLDITDPENFNGSKVLFELSAAHYPELGNILGAAVVAPGSDGRWKIFLGNGHNSDKNAKSNAYLGIIDIEDEYKKARNPLWTSKTKFIATNAVLDNSLAQPALVAGGNGTIQSAYAGDMFGNLWKFDLKDSDPDNWKLAFSGAPLFIAARGTDSDGNLIRQPITSSPNLGVNLLTSPVSTMVYFGTGRYLTEGDKDIGAAVQTFYAIADKGVNITSTNRSTLHQKTINLVDDDERTIQGETVGTGDAMSNAVNWGSVNGWYLDLTANERVTTKPLLLYDRIIFPTIIPSNDPCSWGGSGWLMELIGVGDGNLDYSALENNGNRYLDIAVFGRLNSIQGSQEPPTPSSSASSTSSSGSGSPSSRPSDECSAGGGSSGVIAILATKADSTTLNATGSRLCEVMGRQSWRELR